MKVAANTLRKGMVVEYNDKLWVVMSNDIRTPGKGASVAQVVMRDIMSGTKTDVRFATQDMVERARVEEHEFQFLYANEGEYTFMNNENYEQIIISQDLIGEPSVFLQDGMIVQVQMHEARPLAITLPETVIMEIVEADPVVKGQTASSSYKPAVLENGARVMVPPHIGSGTRIVVRTEDSSYVERAKD
ncbi:MAG: elongation factor P [Bdellovibrionales bacterium]|jgi:elongation factor P|nr:elongation factor P [Bdellovibrionales bacterium]